MSTYCGDEGTIKVAAKGETPVQVGEVKAFNMQTRAAAIRTDAKGAGFESNKGGRKGYNLSLSLHSDSLDAAQADMLEGAQIDFELYTEGEETGREKITGNGLVTEVGRESPEGDSLAARTVTVVPGEDGAYNITAVP